jgi:hypothetical protein
MRTIISRRLSAALALAALVGSLLGAAPTVPVQAADGPATISGTAFMDSSLDGVLDTGEPGVEGVEVRAFGPGGSELGAATTSATGAYTLTLTGAVGGLVRVEFTAPVGLQGTFVTAAAGSTGSSIRFVSPGSTDVDFGVIDPDTTCSLQIAHVCFREGPLSVNPGSRVLGISPFSGPTTGNPPKMEGDPGNNQFGQTIPNDVDGLITMVATKEQVGATWGLAVDRTTGLLWNSAVIRRHTALADRGVGGVYVLDRDGTLVTSFDLEALGLDLRPTVTDLNIATAFGDGGGKVLFTDEARDITGITTTTTTGITGTTYGQRTLMALSRDIPAFAAVGKAGIGDIDLSVDGQYLWVSNLNTRSVHRFPVGGGGGTPTLGTPQAWLLDDGYTCATGTGPFRGWGLDPQPDGTVIAAGVCTNETATPAPGSAPGLGAVLLLDPSKTGTAAWETLTTVDFGYEHVYDFCTTTPRTCTWKSWSSDFTAIAGQNPSDQGQMWWTQPIIMDVATLPDGSFALGINDRFSYMASSNNYRPLDVNDPRFMTAYTAGGLRLLCRTESGWAQEAEGNCSGITEYVTANTASFQPDSFFRNDFQGAHPATSMGALAYGNGVLAYAAMDAASYFSSGIRWVSTADGSQVNALTTSGEYGKASGVGDLEAFCDLGVLQIGNRVWYDVNGDGIQDPDEPPVVGVTVTLYDVEAGEVVGRAVTGADGEYYFTSTNTEDPDSAAGDDPFGGGLVAGRTYEIRLGDPDDCAADGPLDGWDLTIQDATSADGPADRDDLVDSDASAEGVSPCSYRVATIFVAALDEGVVDHSFDIGFTGGTLPATGTQPTAPRGGGTTGGSADASSVGGPVPARVPAGEGPGGGAEALSLLVLLAAAMVLRLRDRSAVREAMGP